MDWLTDNKIPVGKAAKAVFDWMKDHLGPIFDAISAVLEAMIAGILWLLQTPHPLVIIALFLALTWYLQRSWKVCLGILLGFLFILNQGYWEETTESLTLILSACVVCMGLGVPLGIATAHRPRLYQAMVPVLDLMQTLPTFVYLIPVVMLLGIGRVPGFIAVVIYAVPPIIRLTDLGIRLVDKEMLEAADAFGCSPSQKLWKVQMPLAIPTVMAGINQTIMMALGMVVIASMIGVQGLGLNVLQAIANQYFTQGIFNGFAIVGIAIIFDRISQAYGRRLQKHRGASHD